MTRSNFQFLDPKLTLLEFKSNTEFTQAEGQIDINNQFNIEIVKSENENRATVTLTVGINADDPTMPFSLVAAASSDFKWEEINEPNVDSLLSVNAPALLLSYLRPIIATITNSSMYPVYNLPLINFTAED